MQDLDLSSHHHPDIDEWMLLTAERWVYLSDSKLRWLVRRLERKGRMSAVILVLTEYLDWGDHGNFMRVLKYSGERDPTRLVRYAILAKSNTPPSGMPDLCIQLWEMLRARGWWDPTLLHRVILDDDRERFDWLLAHTETSALRDVVRPFTPLRVAVNACRTTHYFARELMRRGARFPEEERKTIPYTPIERYAKRCLHGLRLLYLARHPKFPLPEVMMAEVVKRLG